MGSRVPEWARVAVVLVLGLAARLPFAPADFRGTNDLTAYRAWARLVHTRGLAAAYAGTGINYPPVLLCYFGAIGAVEAQLPLEWRGGDQALTALIKLPSMLADLLTGALIATMARRRALACALYVFNPAVWYVSAYWGQTDSVYTLGLVAALLAIERGMTARGGAAYALAVATKVQSLALAPLVPVLMLRRQGMREMARGMLSGAATVSVLALPWLLAGRVAEVVGAALRVANRQPRLDVSGYNLWYLLKGGNVHLARSDVQPLGMPFSIETLALTLFVALAVYTSLIVWRRPEVAAAEPAALLSLGFFLLMPEVHERYLFPALAFALLAATAQAPLSREWGCVYVLLSLTCLFNLITVAPFTPALGTNLIAAPVDSPKVLALRGLALLAATMNTLILAWIAIRLAGPRPGAAGRQPE